MGVLSWPSNRLQASPVWVREVPLPWNRYSSAILLSFRRAAVEYGTSKGFPVG
jgi:hypothetical protein